MTGEKSNKRPAIRRGPQGVHLYWRDTGLNLLVDEFKVPESDWSLSPRTLSIALLNACDLRCAHCYAPKHGAKLDAKDVIRWAAEAHENGCLNVGFGGGEPTLHPDWIEICAEIRAATCMGVSITTHGLNLDEHSLRRAGPHIDMIRISVDGYGQTYEAIRGRKFTRVADAVRRATDHSQVGINTVINAQTLPDLDSLLEFAMTHGVTEFLLLPELQNGNIALSPSELSSCRAWIERNMHTRILRMSDVGARELDLPVLKVSEADLTREYLHIDADARLRVHSHGGTSVRVGKDGFLNAVKQLQLQRQTL